MASDQNNRDDQSNSDDVPEELSNEVSAAIEELKAAQAKLDAAKAKMASEKAAQTFSDTSQPEDAPSCSVAAVEVPKAPIELEPEILSDTTSEPKETPNWTPYTPSSEQTTQAPPSPDTAYVPTSSQYASVPPAQPYAQQAQPYTHAQNDPQNPPQQQYYYQQPYQQQVVSSKDHVAAGLLGIFLGSLGIHKFYLGYNTSGFIMLAVSILGSIFTFGIAGGVMWVIGVIEGILYLTKSQSEFEHIYVFNKREWF